MEKIDYSFARTDNLSVSYLKISVDNYIEFVTKKGKLKKDDESLNEFESAEIFEKNRIIINEMGENFVISVIFLSMFLESYIYDFSARNKGDSYTSKYLDKLDTVSKWIIIPKIISGVEIDKSRKSFEMLRNLISTRNKLIHWKSKKFNSSELIKNRDKEIYDLINLKEIFIAIKDLFNQLDNGQERKIHNFFLEYIDRQKICE
ncbi:hypothetical protein VP395_10915 [Mariniflexile soesokkakense]|uniref:RiboL-PSP-HEPN domain-containing protein n=1 Tax=Mariniflexile soesokkakense TaxID=1343160 RepID=A0ABV0AFB6_9FLAO